MKKCIVWILVLCCMCSMILPAAAQTRSSSNFILSCENTRNRYVVKGHIMLLNYILCQFGPSGQYAVFNIYRGTTTTSNNFVESYYCEFDNRSMQKNVYLDIKTKNYSCGTYTIEYYVSWTNNGYYSNPIDVRFRTTFEVVDSATSLTGLGLVNDDTSECYPSGSEFAAAKGDRYTFVASFEPSNTTSQRFLKASSSDPTIARFEKNLYGELELEILKTGYATLSIECDNITATFSVVPRCDHEYQCVSRTDPTCVKEGSATYQCTCGDSYSTPLAALGHDMKDGACTRCGSKVSFNDVSVRDYFYEPVVYAVNHGITNGTGNNKFSPEDPCTRGQIVTFLWRANGSPEPSSNHNPFIDVPSNTYYYKAVLWAVEQQITKGVDATHFEPESPCTRGQVATFLWRSEGKPEANNSANSFSDISSREYYYNAVLWAVSEGITNGIGNGRFAPDDTCTRGQIVTFIYRTMT